MGNKREIKLLALTLLFLCACIGMFGRDTSETNREKPLLTYFFSHIEGYTLQRNIKLPENAEKMLNLDDYVYADFAGSAGPINLYIGYYYSPEKAYASHSPTICYPSQGWKIDTPTASGTLKVGAHKINYNEIITSFGRHKELVLYWYQARLSTNRKAYRNKIDMGCNLLINNDSHHGFVRIAIPFANNSYDQVKKRAVDFISSFYPSFHNYLIGS